jgi:hypothetical protein
MEKLNSFFSKFDQFIFQQVDQLKKSAVYEQISAQFEQLSSEQQKLLNRLLTFAAITLPLLILLVLFWGNYSRKQDIAEKLEITNLINQINFKRSIIQSLGSQFLSGEALEDESALLQKIVSFMNGTGVTREQLNIENFESFSITESLQKSEANLKFKKMTTEGLSSLLERMLRNSNFKVSNIEISRTKEAKIEGDLRIHYFGKK